MNEGVTVIIPCYNVEAYIHECLDSVALQGKVVHHIYVVDNNCTDGTVNIVDKWRKANPKSPLTLLSQTKPGAPAARNLPLSRVKTKWIQFLDADDLLLPGKIEDQIRQFPKANVICASAKHLATDGSERTSIPQLDVRLGLIKGEMGNTCANLFSASSIKAIQGWNERLASSQEYDLMFRIWQAGGVFEVDLTPRATIRERHTGQISQRDPAAKWTQLVLLRERMLGSFEADSEVDESMQIEWHQSFFDVLRILAKYELGTALRFYSRVLKPIRFYPKRSDSTTSAYLLCFYFLGFEYTERLKRVLMR